MSQDFISLTCPNCGGKLEITADIERFACGHCGHEHIVRRAGGTISLAPVEAGLQKIQSGTDKTAAELAHKRLREEITAINRKLDDVFSAYDLNNNKALAKFLNKQHAKVEELGFIQKALKSRDAAYWLQKLKEMTWQEVQEFIPGDLKPSFFSGVHISKLIQYRHLLGERHFLELQLNEQRQILDK